MLGDANNNKHGERTRRAFTTEITGGSLGNGLERHEGGGGDESTGSASHLDARNIIGRCDDFCTEYGQIYLFVTWHYLSCLEAGSLSIGGSSEI